MLNSNYYKIPRIQKYVFNITPKFNPKILNFQKNKFILLMIKKINRINFVKNEIMSSMLPIDPKTGNLLVRFRKLNKYRLIAMKTIVQAMLYYFNTNTKKVERSIEQLSDECGLSTISKLGNKSVTRVSRLISEFMEPMGLIRCRKIKNKKNKICKELILTPLFFLLLDKNNISSKNFKNIKQKLKILENKNIRIDSFENVTKRKILKK